MTKKTQIQVSFLTEVLISFICVSFVFLVIVYKYFFCSARLTLQKMSSHYLINSIVTFILFIACSVGHRSVCIMSCAMPNECDVCAAGNVHPHSDGLEAL